MKTSGLRIYSRTCFWNERKQSNKANSEKQNHSGSHRNAPAQPSGASATVVGVPFTALEEKLREAFRISEESLNEPVNEVFVILKTSSFNATSIKGIDIREAIKKCLSKDLKFKAMGKFKEGEIYTETGVKDLIRLSKFECETNFAGENDFLCVLADLKVFLCIEVKCQMDTICREENNYLHVYAQIINDVSTYASLLRFQGS